MKISLIFLGISLSIALFFILPKEAIAAENNATRNTSDTTIVNDSIITLVAVGDIMMGTNFPSDSYLPPRDMLLLEPLYSYLQNADITFGNLEGAVLNEGGTAKKCQDLSKCFAFRQPEYFMGQLKIAGFDFLSVANNHMGDFGQIGRENTCKVLKENKLHFAGLETCPWDTMTVKGLKIGMTGFAPNSGCLQITDYETVRKVVSKLNEMCDVVIVSFHGGAEGSSRSHITKKTEIFYEEDRGNVYEFARVAIDAGADVVLGHGPHVTRAIDLYKGKFITYSMGNFCTYGRFNLNGISGVAPLFQLRLKRDGTFVDGNIVSTKQIGEGGPVLDLLNGALQQIKLLTAADIPGLKLEFGENGFFKFN